MPESEKEASTGGRQLLSGYVPDLDRKLGYLIHERGDRRRPSYPVIARAIRFTRRP
jgi:hypothetical protein